MNNILNIKTPAENIARDRKSDFSLQNHGLSRIRVPYCNLPTPALYEEALFRREGQMADQGPFLVDTGKWTARAANEKYMVRDAAVEDKIWWGEYNRPLSPEKFAGLLHRMQAYFQDRDVFVMDCYAGADENYRLPIRVITEYAWHALFVRNMFVMPRSLDELKRHVPEFTIIAAPSFNAVPSMDGTLTSTFISLSFEKKLGLIGGSGYAGEIKKSIFTVMNYLMPLEGIMSMHCSANVGKAGDVALFFGLSGTGKTTLSADPHRGLIGDDQHGWSDEGVFNYENGCYAKVINLSPTAEPEIHACTRKFGTVLENVIYDQTTRHIDLDDPTRTENTRASYPLSFIDNAVPEAKAGHPQNIIMLTCDASGVMPPISKLTPEQALYHFISGYTAKVAGTEIGLGVEPQITFSACFGAPFMVHHPYFYADLLRRKIVKHEVNCWLVNTGWTGGPYGIGKRISIKHTRALLNAALGGKLLDVPYRTDEIFGFQVPESCPDVPPEILDPANTWGDREAYKDKYRQLALLYIDNFKKFSAGCPADVAAVGPKVD